MFCNRCGTPLQPDYNVCPKCGQSLVPGAAGTAHFERHLRILGTLWMVIGALWLVPSLVFMSIGNAVPFMMHRSLFGNVLLPPLMFGLGTGFLLVAAGGICVGWGLMQREPWARVAAIVLGILALLHPPVGTLLGIYTLWVMLSHDVTAYDRVAQRR